MSSIRATAEGASLPRFFFDLDGHDPDDTGEDGESRSRPIQRRSRLRDGLSPTTPCARFGDIGQSRCATRTSNQNLLLLGGQLHHAPTSIRVVKGGEHRPLRGGEAGPALVSGFPVGRRECGAAAYSGRPAERQVVEHSPIPLTTPRLHRLSEKLWATSAPRRSKLESYKRVRCRASLKRLSDSRFAADHRWAL